MVKLNKNRSENFLAFVSTRARCGSRPIRMFFLFSRINITIHSDHEQDRHVSEERLDKCHASLQRDRLHFLYGDGFFRS